GTAGQVDSRDAHLSEILDHRHGIDSARGKSSCYRERVSVVLVFDFAGRRFAWNVRTNLCHVSIPATMAHATVGGSAVWRADAEPACRVCFLSQAAGFRCNCLNLGCCLWNVWTVPPWAR